MQGEVDAATQYGQVDGCGCGGVAEAFDGASACASLFGRGLCAGDAEVFGAEKRLTALSTAARHLTGSVLGRARYVVGYPHACVDEVLAGFGEHGVGCAVVGDGAAFAEHDNAVHVRRPDAHAVFYDEQGRTGHLRGGKNTVAHFLYAGGVEVGGGFVEDHGAGVHREDTR